MLPKTSWKKYIAVAEAAGTLIGSTTCTLSASKCSQPQLDIRPGEAHLEKLGVSIDEAKVAKLWECTSTL